MSFRKIVPARFAARLVAADALSPSVRGLTFEREDGPLDYLPGQWVKLYLGELDRDYSIASAPSTEAPSRFELAVTRVEGGPGSAALHALELGQTLRMSGPSGFFVREDEHLSCPALLIGTGTGVAPLRAMIQSAYASGSASAPHTLLFGTRHEADQLYEEEWRRLEAAAPTFRFAPTLSRASDAWKGRRGWVQNHVGELLEELGPDTHVYICGLSRMVGEVRTLLRGPLGLARQRVHSERYD